jgi:hypothetical protein
MPLLPSLLFKIDADGMATLMKVACDHEFIEGLEPQIYACGYSIWQYADDGSISMFEDDLKCVVLKSFFFYF